MRHMWSRRGMAEGCLEKGDVAVRERQCEGKREREGGGMRMRRTSKCVCVCVVRK